MRALGFDNNVVVVWIVALTVVVLMRPKELNVFKLLPFVIPLLALSIHLASRTVAGIKSVHVPSVAVVTVAWFITTTVWSEAPVLSAAASVQIICVTVMAMIVGSFCSLRELTGGVLAGALAVLIVSAAVAVVAPGYGLVSVAYQEGSLQGVMLDRNSLSFDLLLGLTASLAFDFRGSRARVRKAVLAALFFGGVVWTSSSTCLVLAIVVLLLAVALAVVRTVPPSRRGRALAACALAASAAAFYVLEHIDELFKLVDRDSTLSGRTHIWPVVEAIISTRPWLGQGWGGVWGDVPLNQQINRAIGFTTSHPHNGYLDLKLQVGMIGLVLFLLMILLLAVRGVAQYLKSSSSLSSWPLILIVILLVYNRVETSFTAPPSSLFLIVATLVVLSMGKISSAMETCTVQTASGVVKTVSLS